MAKKDYIPLYIAIASGGFSLLNVIADNLTKNVTIVVNTAKASKAAVKAAAPLMSFVVQNLKSIVPGAISIIAIILFVVLRNKKPKK